MKSSKPKHKKKRRRKSNLRVPIDEHIKDDYVLMKFLRSEITARYSEALFEKDVPLSEVLDDYFQADTRDVYWAEAKTTVKSGGIVWRKGRLKENVVIKQVIPAGSVFLVRHDMTIPDEITIEYLNKNNCNTVLSLTRQEWDVIKESINVIVILGKEKYGTQKFDRVAEFYRDRVAATLGCSATVVARQRMVFRRGNISQEQGVP